MRVRVRVRLNLAFMFAIKRLFDIGASGNDDEADILSHTDIIVINLYVCIYVYSAHGIYTDTHMFRYNILKFNTFMSSSPHYTHAHRHYNARSRGPMNDADEYDDANVNVGVLCV